MNETYIDIKRIAEIKGLKSTRSIRIAIQKGKYIAREVKVNGGMLGLTETFYKGNFWTAITANTGASVAEANTMYGKDDMTSLMAGVGSKTGYNFEFAEGKFIIQPRIFLHTV